MGRMVIRIRVSLAEVETEERLHSVKETKVGLHLRLQLW